MFLNSLVVCFLCVFLYLALLRDCSLCWDHLEVVQTPHTCHALPCGSRAGVLSMSWGVLSCALFTTRQHHQCQLSSQQLAYSQQHRQGNLWATKYSGDTTNHISTPYMRALNRYECVRERPLLLIFEVLSLIQQTQSQLIFENINESPSHNI